MDDGAKRSFNSFDSFLLMFLRELNDFGAKKKRPYKVAIFKIDN
jgi:hypothetical protein